MAVVAVAFIVIVWLCTKPFPHNWVSLNWGLVHVRARGLIRCTSFTVMWCQWPSTVCHLLHCYLLLRQVVTVRPRFSMWEETVGPPGGELQGVHCVVATFRLWTHKTQTHTSVYPLIKVRGQVFTINFLRNPPQLSVPLVSPPFHSFSSKYFLFSLDGKCLLWLILLWYYDIFPL